MAKARFSMVDEGSSQCQPGGEIANNDKSLLHSYGDWVMTFNQRLVNKIFIPLFFNVADHPYVYIIAVLFISILLPAIAITTGSIEVETNTAITTIPQDSYPAHQNMWLAKNFRKGRPSTVLLHSSGNNVLTKEAISVAFDIAEAIPTVADYERKCGPFNVFNLPVESGCEYHSVSLFWDDRSGFEKDMNGLFSVHDQMSVIAERVSAEFYANGQPAERAYLFGQITIQDNSTGIISFVSALSNTLLLFESPGDFEMDFVETLQNQKQNHADVKMTLFTTQYLNYEIEKPIADDLPLVGTAAIIMSVFTALAMTRWRRNSKGQRFVTSNFALGLGATVTVLLSTATAYSFCGLCGYPITNVTQTLPFIMMGIGLDDAFVLVGAYYESNPTLPFRDRLAEMARSAGPSIALTTLTDCAAFAFGSSSNIPAIRWFGFYAVMAVAIDFIYQVTFFVAILVVDHQRSKNGRLDCLCCFKAGSQTETDEDNRNNNGSSSFSFKIKFPRRRKSSVREAPRQNTLMKSYASCLLQPVVKGVVLVVFTALFVGGTILASHATLGMKFSDMTPKNAVTDQFTEAFTKYFATDEGATSVQLYYNDLDLSNSSVRQEMLNFRYEILRMGADNYPRTNSFLEDFDSFVGSNSNVTTQTFADQLSSFFAVEEYYFLYSEKIKMKSANDTHPVLREDIVLALDISEPKDQVEFAQQQRQITLRQPLNRKREDSVERMFLFHNDIDLYEHYRMVPKELAMSLILSLVAVTVIAAFFLPHPTATLLSVLAIIFVDIELVGVIVLVGYTINSITMVLLIMSIGLVADYVLHVVHGFLHVDGLTRDSRVTLCLRKIGGSVFLGGITTFLGILALAFSQGAVFFQFFVVFCAMVVLGLAHGLIWMPVVLSLVGPHVVISSDNVMHMASSHFMMRSSHRKSVVFQKQEQQELDGIEEINCEFPIVDKDHEHGSGLSSAPLQQDTERLADISSNVE